MPSIEPAPSDGGAEAQNPLKRLREILLGRPKDIHDPEIFRNLSLIAFLAWVGLGADGLSSSCYGPEEAFLALGAHRHLALFLAGLTALTVFVISASYSQIIELFPSGGGGYVVSSHLLGAYAGLTSGCALVVDYMMTISISIASGADALFSFLPPGWVHAKLPTEVATIVLLIFLNLRGVRESVMPMVPVFLAFLIMHMAMIGYALLADAGNLPSVIAATASETRKTVSEVGLFATVVILLRAFSLGGGTFTGIEAVSNGLQILREPRVNTGKRTMRYMSVSLAFTAAGLLVSFLLSGVGHESGRTLNASLFYRLTSSWVIGGADIGHVVVAFTLFSEAVLLFVAAQAGFLDGPRVLANMAVDYWLPVRFAHLSDHLVTQDGILVMGGSALLILLVTHGSVSTLVVLYSINVFLTFSLSQLGMVLHWWRARSREPAWTRRLAINGFGLLLTTTILVATVALKFRSGGWVTLAITGAAIFLCLLIRRHYDWVHAAIRNLALTLGTPAVPAAAPPPTNADRSACTAVVMVSDLRGIGMHTLLSISRHFRDFFENAVLLEIGVIDSSRFKGRSEIERLEQSVQEDLREYVKFAERLGFHAESRYRLGTDQVRELEQLCLETAREFPESTFFAGRIVLPRQSFFSRYLHNHTAAKVEERLQLAGLDTMVLPLVVGEISKTGVARQTAI